MAAKSSEAGGRNAYLYRLGVRLRALELLITYADHRDDLAVACRYVRLVDHDIQACDFASRVWWQVGDAKDLLQRVHWQLESLRLDPPEIWDLATAELVNDAAEIAAIIVDSLNGAEADWFELGCVIVPVSTEYIDLHERSELDWPGADVDARDPRHHMTWPSIRRLEDALRKTGAALEECLIEPDYDAADRFDQIGRFPDVLWPLEWIERALASPLHDWLDRNQQPDRDEEEPLKPASKCTLRNLYFLAWYQDESTKTHKSPAAIRDRWNAEHPEAKIGTNGRGREIVKQGIKAAKKFLHDKRVKLPDAIKQLEQQEPPRQSATARQPVRLIPPTPLRH
jgi:hypothetical protein